MPEISQKTLDVLTEALATAKSKLIQKEDKATITREVVAGLLATELKPVLEKLNANVDALKNIKIVTPPIEVQPIKANVSANVPEIKMPEIKIPEIKVPDVIIPEIKIPKAKAPVVNITVPDVIVPEIKIPAIKMSKMKAPVLDTDAIYKGVNNDKAKPLPVVLTDEKGKFYKAIMTAISGGGGGGGSFEALKSVSTPVVSNTLLAAGDTQYSVVLSKGTKKFKIYAVDSTRITPHPAVLRYSYTSLGNGSWAAKTCIPIPAGNYGSEEGLELKVPTTLYFSSPTGGNAVVVVVAWQ